MENTNRVPEQARYDAERRQADEALAGVFPAVSIFGSARTPQNHADYAFACRL
ncbi:TIGR00730 family Rossman fold protein, partial [Neisseria meningitidis]|nr:TIGR00730 family Rossman fold protein [Neisseria meningitidis]